MGINFTGNARFFLLVRMKIDCKKGLNVFFSVVNYKAIVQLFNCCYLFYFSFASSPSLAISFAVVVISNVSFFLYYTHNKTKLRERRKKSVFEK